MGYLSDLVLTAHHAGIRQQYNTIALAMYVLSVIKKVTVFDQPNGPLWKLVSETLAKISTLSPDAPLNEILEIESHFEHTVLTIEGIIDLPHLSATDRIERISAYSEKSIKRPRYL